MLRAGPCSAAAAALLALFASCAGFTRWPWGSTQRWPGPMEATVDPLPPGDTVPQVTGPEEVYIVRHADPVQVRPAGLPSSFPLSFYDKDIRVGAGSTVYSAPGGRVEILWPDGTSIVMFGRGTGIVGSPSRGEPAFTFREVERALLDLKHDEEIELYGGAHLTASSGPFILDHVRADILRVKNQAPSAGRIAFREAVFTLDPGQVVDLPMLSAGAKPAPRDSGLAFARASGFSIEYGGAIERVPAEGAVVLAASGDHEIHGLGVNVRLRPGEEARFRGLERGARPPSPPAVAPTTEESAPKPPPVEEEEPPAPPIDPQNEIKPDPVPPSSPPSR
jgi:hypothetical protein